MLDRITSLAPSTALAMAVVAIALGVTACATPRDVRPPDGTSPPIAHAPPDHAPHREPLPETGATRGVVGRDGDGITLYDMTLRSGERVAAAGRTGFGVVVLATRRGSISAHCDVARVEIRHPDRADEVEYVIPFGTELARADAGSEILILQLGLDALLDLMRAPRGSILVVRACDFATLLDVEQTDTVRAWSRAVVEDDAI